jgi:hypothetical protein
MKAMNCVLENKNSSLEEADCRTVHLDGEDRTLLEFQVKKKFAAKNCKKEQLLQF